MKKIVIVDDEPSILMSLEYTFRKNKFDVFIARDGQEALELLEYVEPDLILLDIMMPKVDGYQILKFIRNHPALKEVRVVFVSAKNKEQDVSKGLEAGADAYVAKPFSLKKLVEQVNELLIS